MTDRRNVDWWLACWQGPKVLHSPARWTLQQHRALAAPPKHGEADLFKSPGHVPPIVFVGLRLGLAAGIAA